jgi:hypothetical protein
MAGAWWPVDSLAVKDEDVTSVMRAWYCTSFVTEEKHAEYLARCACLGLPFLMNGWEIPTYCRTVEAAILGLDEAVGEWDESAAEEGKKGSELYYEQEEVDDGERWLKSNPFLFWLLGHVIEDAAKRWAEDNALGIIEERNEHSSHYVRADRELREEIEKAAIRFFKVYREQLLAS